MKRILLGFSFLLIAINAFAQDPIRWEFSAKRTAPQTYEIHLAATLGEGWHTYSQTSPDGGAKPTEIVFNKNPAIVLVGKVKEDGFLETKHEAVFDADVKYYRVHVDFVQIVKLKNPGKTTVTGTLAYMVCNDQMCLPPEKFPFSVDIADDQKK
jgi:DsbC/DsbD-like thiol-disulfide interchange protein